MGRAGTLAVLVVLGACGAGAPAATAVYTNRDAFVSVLQGDFYLEQFNDSNFGYPHCATPWADYGPVNGYAYRLTSSPHALLFSVEGAETVDISSDELVANFTGRPVYAVGGRFYGVGLLGDSVPSLVRLTLSDGTFWDSNNVNVSISNFVGFTSTIPIVSLSVNAGHSGMDTGPTMDDFYVGAPLSGGAPPIPEPLTLCGAGLGIGAVGAYLRRRIRARA
jgi:hypothetical protein